MTHGYDSDSSCHSNSSSNHCDKKKKCKRDCKYKKCRVKVKAYAKVPCDWWDTVVLKCDDRCVCLKDRENAVFVKDDGCYKVYLPCDPCGPILFDLPACATVKVYTHDKCRVGKLCERGVHLAVYDCKCGKWYVRGC